MKYVVKATCFFENRYYKKGETVDFNSAVKPPKHFELVDPPKKQESKEPVDAAKPKTAVKTRRGNQAKAKEKDNG